MIDSRHSLYLYFILTFTYTIQYYEQSRNCVPYEGSVSSSSSIEDFYYTRSAVDASVTQSQVLSQVAQEKLTWESGLLAPLNPDEETNAAPAPTPRKAIYEIVDEIDVIVKEIDGKLQELLIPKIDECEDRYPPNIVLRNAEIFRCDDDDTTRLCYTDKWFKNNDQVLNFLGYQFPAADDCAPTTKLEVTIEKTGGTSCDNTEYTITPSQNYPECNDQPEVGPFDLPFTNPLFGNTKTVTLQLDEEAPTVECGFIPNSNSINVIEGKTLYHYMLKSDRAGDRLEDSQLFYDVTVSTESGPPGLSLCIIFYVI